jgi:hypothetical protein
MWWAYAVFCIGLYFAVFTLSDFLTALAMTVVAIAGLGLLITWLSRL